MATPDSDNHLVPDFVKFMSSNKGLIDDMLEKADPSRVTLLNANQCRGTVTHVAYRYDKLTGLCTAVVRVK